MENASNNSAVRRVRRYRDTHNDYLAVRVQKADGSRSSLLLDMAVVTKRGELRSHLLRKGVSHASLDDAVDYIPMNVPDKAGRLVRKPGWAGTTFVLANGKTIGSRKVMLHPDFRELRKSSAEGDLDVWNSTVVKSARRAPLPLFALLHSFAAPLLKLSKTDEGAIFHFYGASSTGKTSITGGAISCYGPPSALKSWDATPRGLFERAAKRNDHQLVLDDTGTLSKEAQRALPSMIYKLASGSSAHQSAIVHDRLPVLTWRLWGLSTGEHSMKELLGAEMTAGLGARIIDIPIPSVSEGGVWRSVEGRALSKQANRSEGLKSRSERVYGHAFEPWVRYLVERDELDVVVQRLVVKFIDAYAVGATGLELRVAKKFALVYAAGCLAVEAGILHCKISAVRRSVVSVMRLANPASENPATIARRVLRFAKDKSVVARFKTDQWPSFTAEKTVSAYVQHKSGRLSLHVTKDRLDVLLGRNAAFVKAEWTKTSVLIATASGEHTKQERVVVGGKKHKLRFIEIDLKQLSRIAAG